MRRVLAVLPGFAFALAGQDSRPTSLPRAPRALERITMLGASVTAGFDTGRRVLETAIRTDHDDLHTSATALFGASPRQMLANQVAVVMRREPTLVIAMDALFWFLYQPAEPGKGCDDARSPQRTEPAETAAKRLALLDTALATLEKVTCPLVLGEVPDMHDVTAYLRGEQVPSPDTLKRANARIHAFAKERGRCLVLPFAHWVEELRAGRLVLPEGLASDPKERFPAEVALMGDRLHPSQTGQVLLAAWLVRSLESWLGAKPGEFGLDAKALAELRK